MKIVIQSYAHSGIVSCYLENLLVLSLRHSDLGDMNSIKSVLAKYGRRARSKTLVKQNSFHAT